MVKGDFPLSDSIEKYSAILYRNTLEDGSAIFLSPRFFWAAYLISRYPTTAFQTDPFWYL